MFFCVLFLLSQAAESYQSRWYLQNGETCICDMDIEVEGRGAELRGKRADKKSVVVAILCASLGI